MNDRTMRRILAATMAGVIAVVLGAGLLTAEKTEGRAQRSFVFIYEVQVPAAPAGSEQSRLWIPLPQSDEHQSISKLVIESRVAHRTGKDPEYGNSYAVFTPPPAEAAGVTT